MNGNGPSNLINVRSSVSENSWYWEESVLSRHLGDVEQGGWENGLLCMWQGGRATEVGEDRKAGVACRAHTHRNPPPEACDPPEQTGE